MYNESYFIFSIAIFCMALGIIFAELFLGMNEIIGTVWLVLIFLFYDWYCNNVIDEE